MATASAPGERCDSDFFAGEELDSEPTFQNVFQRTNLNETEQEEDAMEIDPPQVAFRQTLLPGAAPAAPAKTPNADRCAVCVYSYCVKRHECPGNGNRKLCLCGHPPAPKRVRISEAKILAHLEKQRNGAARI